MEVTPVQRATGNAFGSDLVLDESARNVCRVMSRSPMARAFYLAGGTGLALQLSHRVSLDLDFFQLRPGERIDSAAIASSLEDLFPMGMLSLRISQIDQCTWSIGTTKTSFIAYPFPLLYDAIQGQDLARGMCPVQIADVRDIACMKAYALGRRATFRDYLDLYFVLRGTGVTLDSLILDCVRKFVTDGHRLFSQKLFLEQLVYTEDVEDRDVTLRLLFERPDGVPTASDVDQYLRQSVKEYLHRQVDRPEGGML